MSKFLIDEDMPRSTTKLLKDKGFIVFDVRDCGLKGKSEEEIFRFAQQEKAVILTADIIFCVFLLAVIQGLLLLTSLMRFRLMS